MMGGDREALMAGLAVVVFAAACWAVAQLAGLLGLGWW